MKKARDLSKGKKKQKAKKSNQANVIDKGIHIPFDISVQLQTPVRVAKRALRGRETLAMIGAN